MGKTPSKKPQERRKRPRGPASARKAERTVEASSPDVCAHCTRALETEDRALFVEEEVGRVFCSEDCITAYFGPEIERLEKDFYENVSKSDLTGQEREKLAHLRWVTLQEPDEIWREKTLTGDQRFTLISEFQPAEKKIWCVCICLFLRGEPSFLYLAFPTRNAAMVDGYRRGERVEWAKKAAKEKKAAAAPSEAMEEEEAEEAVMDGLADEWTEEETYRAQIGRTRRSDDIPADEFGLYQTCLDETLETPDEVWTLEAGEKTPWRIYQFIRRYPDEKPSGMWFVIVAKESDDEEEIEILEAFPTRDPELVDCYRRGDQQIGEDAGPAPANRLVH